MKTERGGERNWDPLQLQLFVILTQIQHWNMATMWTLSRSVAPGSARPIRGDVAVRGGGPWGGSGSRSLREREALKSVSQGREDTSPGELDYPQTDGDRLDSCLTFFCFLHSFPFRPTEVTPGVSSCHSLMSQRLNVMFRSESRAAESVRMLSRCAEVFGKDGFLYCVITAEEQWEQDCFWVIYVVVTDLLRRLLPCGLELQRSVDEIKLMCVSNSLMSACWMWILSGVFPPVTVNWSHQVVDETRHLKTLWSSLSDILQTEQLIDYSRRLAVSCSPHRAKCSILCPVISCIPPQ